MLPLFGCAYIERNYISTFSEEIELKELKAHFNEYIQQCISRKLTCIPLLPPMNKQTLVNHFSFRIIWIQLIPVGDLKPLPSDRCLAINVKYISDLDLFL